MRKFVVLTLAGFALAASSPLGAQERDRTQRTNALPLSRAVANEIADLYNGPAALRANGQLEIAEDRTVEGNVAMLNGPLTVAGHVAGRVVAVNADVALRRGARIDGDLIVVGGSVTGREQADVSGEIRIYRQVLYYRLEGDVLVPEGRDDDEYADAGDDSWYRRWERRRDRSVSKLSLTSGGTYNRVEGLSVLLGPVLRREVPWGRLDARAYGIVRTADDFRWNSENLGHDVSVETRIGNGVGVSLGGRLYDVVSAVEPWWMRDVEVGLASFLFHRDYRDYYNRHGGSARLALFLGEDADFSLSFADESWDSRAERDPFTLTRNSRPWRENPAVDEGRFHIANATLRVDTRTDEDHPWSGWYIVADYERGTGLVERAAVNAAPSPALEAAHPLADGRAEYSRGFVDLRRYNRVSPGAQLNMRLVLGAWLNGDPLPLQRRFSVGGPGSLPGFDFRRAYGAADVGTCSIGAASPGMPALCERMALAQVEYRGELDFHLFDWDDDDDRDRDRRSDRGRWSWHDGVRADGEWVVFADAGRGWLVGDRSGEMQYPRGAFPRLGTFRTDLGIGLDLGSIGIYLAKSVSESSEPANVFLRVGHRF